MTEPKVPMAVTIPDLGMVGNIPIPITPGGILLTSRVGRETRDEMIKIKLEKRSLKQTTGLD